MAKWDLSKLPEGRKPLPDEWFRERAQMQDRIEELEALLAKAVSFLDELRNEQCYDASVLIDLIKELTGGKDER